MRKKYPYFGETRIVSRFLLFPLKLGREKRWLERVKIKQYYSREWNPFFGDVEGWKDFKFVDE